jgi:hypothetical protein
VGDLALGHCVRRRGGTRPFACISPVGAATRS